MISDAAGWRLDRYLLREVNRRGIKTATAIVGWDNPSSNGLVGASVEYVNVWSDIHAWEMNVGLDWPMEKIHVGGMPLYDNYLSGKWAVPREEYFKIHGLDPKKKLVAFVATAMNITPNLHLVELLAEMISRANLPSLPSCWSACTRTISAPSRITKRSAKPSSKWQSATRMCTWSLRKPWLGTCRVIPGKISRKKARCWRMPTWW